MFHKASAVALLALTLLLSGCGLGERHDASTAIARFLAGVARDDRVAFEAGIDRAALRADLAGQTADLGKARGLDIGEAPSEFAIDRTITLQTVRATAARTAPGWPAAPTAAQVVPRMKVLDRKHVCLEQQGSKLCLLSFTKSRGAWRLAGMAAGASQP